MGPSIVRVALAFSLASAPGQAGAPLPGSVDGLTHPAPEAPPQATQSVSYAPPASTWIAAGVAVGLFATGLGFTLTATSIGQQAGNLNANGVDVGITRAQAVQGLNDVRIGNTLLVGAGLALVAAVTFAVIHAKNISEAVAAPTAAQPLALQWNLP
jgi:hypothetical protein